MVYASPWEVGTEQRQRVTKMAPVEGLDPEPKWWGSPGRMIWVRPEEGREGRRVQPMLLEEGK